MGNEMSWLAKSFLSLIFIIPAWLSIGFFAKVYQIRPEVTMIYYFAGAILGTILLIPLGLVEIPLDAITPSLPILFVILIGIILGSMTNAMVFGAITTAPNRGLPIAIQGSASVFVFVLSYILAILFPAYFDASNFNLKHLLGVLLTLAGLYFIVR